MCGSLLLPPFLPFFSFFFFSDDASIANLALRKESLKIGVEPIREFRNGGVLSRKEGEPTVVRIS